MPSGLYNWSQTAGSNATADSSVNWAEGQSPSSVNDSARAMMASVAKYRDDISGAIATGGTSTAYTVTSYSSFSTLALMANQMIAFTPHATNAATVTLNVDGLGAKPLRSAPSTELLAGTLIQGTPYVAVYNNSDAVWYLQGFYGNAYNVPLGGAMLFTGTTAPNSSFVFPYGQALNRTTYATYFSMVGTTYGAGDGSTTFNVLDLRGRVPAGKDDMGGSSANRLTAAGGGVDGGTLAADGGTQTKTLTTPNLPAYTPTGTVATDVKQQSGATQGIGIILSGAPGTIDYGGAASGATPSNLTAVSAFTGVAQGGTSTAFGVVQPTIICNYILRII